MYSILFVLSLLILRRRKARDQANNRIHIIYMVVIFFLTTMVIILHSAINVYLIYNDEFQLRHSGAVKDPNLVYAVEWVY